MLMSQVANVECDALYLIDNWHLAVKKQPGRNHECFQAASVERSAMTVVFFCGHLRVHSELSPGPLY